MPNPMQPSQNRPMRSDPPPSPLSCAIILGECIRDERGKQGVCCYVGALMELLPFPLVEQIAYRLNVPLPEPPKPLPPPPQRAKQNDGMQMNQLMQMVRMMEQFKKPGR
ncbi:MAG: hypothetical protein PHT58_07880 [Eubacteriales bacterium]|nr:hypothetical protein [Eubacteriales bacterium]